MKATLGTVWTVNLERGFGFIRAHGAKRGERDLFFHASALDGLDFNEQLIQREVSVELEHGPKGLRAAAVRPV